LHPCRHVQRCAESRIDRFPSTAELPSLGETYQKLEAAAAEPPLRRCHPAADPDQHAGAAVVLIFDPQARLANRRGARLPMAQMNEPFPDLDGDSFSTLDRGTPAARSSQP